MFGLLQRVAFATFVSQADRELTALRKPWHHSMLLSTAASEREGANERDK